MFMNKIILSMSFLLFGFFAFSQNKVVSDSHAEKRSVSGFHAIRISHGIDLYLSQGEDAVAISATDLDVRNH